MNYITYSDPIVDALAFGIFGASIYFILRQKTGQQPDVKNLLTVIYSLFEGVMLLEILRNFLTGTFFMRIYAVGATSFILLIVALVTIVGNLVYLKPTAAAASQRFKKIFTKFPHGYITLAFLGFIVYSNLSIVIYPNEYEIVELPNAFGIMAPLKTASFSQSWLADAAVVLVVFIVFSTSLFLAAARKTSNPSARRALYIIPMSWIAVGLELLTFNGLLVQMGHDLIGFGYVIAATAAAFAAYSFRDTSTVASIFSPIQGQTIPVSNPFSKLLGAQSRTRDTFLLEVDPSVPFEKVIEDFSIEQISNRSPVFLFSSKGDPLYKVLSKLEGTRFFMFSDVSYPKSTDHPFEVLVPSNDQSIILDVLQKTVEAAGEQNVAIIYNSLTNMILSSGLETCYKFLKSARDILSKPSVSALFIIVDGAHDEKTTNIIKSLFSNQVRVDKEGLRVVKSVEVKS